MRIENKTRIDVLKGKAYRISTYDYNYVANFEEFGNIWHKEKEKNNIDKCYYAVSLWGEELATFDNVKKAKEFAIKDYEELSQEDDTFGVDSLEDYTITINLYTKTNKNFKGFVYVHELNINEI